MDKRLHLGIRTVNLLFLIAGLLIGPVVVKSIDLLGGTVIHAQDEKSTPKVPAKTDPGKGPPDGCDSAHFECVAASISTGTAAFGVVLSNKMASDQVMVNGFDLIKLHDATLTALRNKGILTASEVQAIVDGAKISKPLRLKTK